MSQDLSEKKWNTPQQVLILSALIVIVAQVNLHVFTDSFKVSIAPILIPVILCYAGHLPLIPLAFCSSGGVYLCLSGIYLVRSGAMPGASVFFPEACFYFIMGMLYWGYTRFHPAGVQRHGFLLYVFFFDYLSNAAELFLHFYLHSFAADKQLFILAVAAVRTFIVWLILFVADRYRLTLLRRAHAERYQRLILLMSRLEGEVTWMEKNANRIEDTMNTAYDMYRDLQKSGSPESERALDVAKEIHEIKKEYYLIMRGISEALNRESRESGMSFQDLFTILGESLKTLASTQGIQVTLVTDFQDSLYTSDPYTMVSIFRNLFSNSLDAAEAEENRKELTITVTERRREAAGSEARGEESSSTEDACGEKSCGESSGADSRATAQAAYLIDIRDNGPGIPAELRDQIFNPGFSTRINYETGVISRGLGLPVVQDLAQRLGGSIELLEQTGGPGACFRLTIPESRLEVMDE